jgi:hypothetical protein
MIGAGFLFLLVLNQAYAQTDPLPSWNDGAAKQAIVEFVKTTTDKASPKFVPPAERIAAFDQDGSGSSIRCTRSLCIASTVLARS